MKRTMIGVLIGAWLGVSAGFLQAETITLDRAVREALASNLGLKEEALKMGIKSREHDHSWNKFLPSVSVGGGLVRMNNTAAAEVPIFATPSGSLLEFVPDSWDAVLSVNAVFSLNAATFAAIDETTTEYENSQLSYRGAALRLQRDVKKVFYQLMVLQETLQLTQKQIDNAEERYRQAQVSLQSGLVPELTVLLAQVAWENRLPGLEDLKVNLSQALFAFEALLGRSPDPSLELQGSLEFPVPTSVPTAENLIATYLPRRIDLQLAAGQVRAAEGVEAVQDDLQFPTFLLEWTADPGLNDPFSSKTPWLTTGNWIQTYGALSFLVSWKLDSLVPGSSSDDLRHASSDQVSWSETTLQQTRLVAEAEITTLVLRIHKSLATLKNLNTNVEVAKRAYNLTQEAFRTGARSLLEVQDADLQYQSSQLTLLNEKQVLHAALLDLEVALNTPLEEIHGIEE